MLYLLERGNLDVRWPASPSDTAEESDVGEGGNEDIAEEAIALPMSVQGGYAVVIGREEDGKISLERWNVYAGLRRSGYAVVRAPTWLPPTEEVLAKSNTNEEESGRETAATDSTHMGLLRRLFGSLFASKGPPAPPPRGPLVGPGLYRSYGDIYRLLQSIPTHTSSIQAAQDPSTPSNPSTISEPPFRIAFHVYKPSPTFRKSSPGVPDFRIAVLSARDSSTPTLAQLSALFDSVPFDPHPNSGA
ncbi:MAG: hypothetical protein M4579_007573, partial [Chaenotheca gracillima]